MGADEVHVVLHGNGHARKWSQLLPMAAACVRLACCIERKRLHNLKKRLDLRLAGLDCVEGSNGDISSRKLACMHACGDISSGKQIEIGRHQKSPPSFPRIDGTRKYLLRGVLALERAVSMSRAR